MTYRSVLVLFLLPALAAQTTVNFANWTEESYPPLSGTNLPNWAAAPNGLSVTQSANSQPSLFYSDFDVLNLRLEGQIVVTATDDDFVGFALGFRSGDTTNPNADYLLIDWKRSTQSYNFGAPSCTPGSTAPAGLAISRVEGIPTADELWGHVDLNTSPCSTPNDKVTELQRAITLGSTGWVRNQTYTFRIDYSPTRVVVLVDNVLELDVQGSFGNGRIAFYNFSQAGSVYSAFTSLCIASYENYGVGHPGSAGIPSLTSSADPVLGTQIDLEMTGVAPTAGLGALAFGLTGANAPTGFGGNLLVNAISLEIFNVPVAPAQAIRPFHVPLSPAFCGVEIFTQFAQFDVGASHGIAFSPGLKLHLGN